MGKNYCCMLTGWATQDIGILHTQLRKKNYTEHLLGIRSAINKLYPYASFNFFTTVRCT